MLLASSQLLPARSHFTFSALCVAQFPANAMLHVSRQVAIAITPKTLFIDLPLSYCLPNVSSPVKNSTAAEWFIILAALFLRVWQILPFKR
jgi:hypothetical protein